MQGNGSDPRKKLAYSWRYEGYGDDSLVTFELFAEGNKTRLKLMHEALESFPPMPDFAGTNFVEGWSSLIGSSLKNFVEGSDLNPSATNTGRRSATRWPRNLGQSKG